MPTLADVAVILKQQLYAVVSTMRPSGTIQSTLANVGLYEDGVAFTATRRSHKEHHLKWNSACTVTIHYASADSDRAYGLPALCSDAA